MTEITEVLIEYDSDPLIHIRQNEEGDKFFCYFYGWGSIDVDGEFHPRPRHLRSDFQYLVTYITVPISNEELTKLKANQIDIRSLFEKPKQTYVLEFDSSPYTQYNETIKQANIPEEFLPHYGVRLRP